MVNEKDHEINMVFLTADFAKARAALGPDGRPPGNPGAAHAVVRSNSFTAQPNPYPRANSFVVLSIWHSNCFLI